MAHRAFSDWGVAEFSYAFESVATVRAAILSGVTRFIFIYRHGELVMLFGVKRKWKIGLFIGCRGGTTVFVCFGLLLPFLIRAFRNMFIFKIE